MRCLIDTHVALFMWVSPEKLSNRVRVLLENKANEIYFSQVSVWEITLKYGLKKLRLPISPDLYIPDRLKKLDLTYTPLTNEAIYGVLGLPEIHRDPFDRLLISTALDLGIPLISRDPFIQQYPLQVLW